MEKKVEKLEEKKKKTPKSKKEPKESSKYGSICSVWDFRLNFEAVKPEVLLSFMKNNAKRFVFQKEKGDETGYLHYQGRFKLMKKRYKQQLINLFESNNIPVPNYLKPTCKENHKDDFFYVMKEDTRCDNLIFYDDVNKLKYTGVPNVGYLPVQYRSKKLYPFQETILASKDWEDYRTINCLCDFVGNLGKSYVSAIAEILHGAIDMPPLNDFKELISLMCNICMDTENRSPKLVFFDMPRAMSKNSLLGFYSAVEQIKKGKLYDMRYHYKSYWIDSPTVWVFTNQRPDVNLLSRDRWVFWKVTDNKELVKYDIEAEILDDEISQIN